MKRKIGNKYICSLEGYAYIFIIHDEGCWVIWGEWKNERQSKDPWKKFVLKILNNIPLTSERDTPNSR